MKTGFRSALLLGALCLLFFFSGACALIYQVLWLRTLGWVFGVTVYAASAVWAMFMTGLALGSSVAGLVADRVRNPLRWFGVTEVLIGATAFVTPSVLSRLQQAYVSATSLSHSLAALTATHLAMAFAVLIDARRSSVVTPGPRIAARRPWVTLRNQNG